MEGAHGDWEVGCKRGEERRGRRGDEEEERWRWRWNERTSERNEKKTEKTEKTEGGGSWCRVDGMKRRRCRDGCRRRVRVRREQATRRGEGKIGAYAVKVSLLPFSPSVSFPTPSTALDPLYICESCFPWFRRTRHVAGSIPGGQQVVNELEFELTLLVKVS